MFGFNWSLLVTFAFEAFSYFSYWLRQHTRIQCGGLDVGDPKLLFCMWVIFVLLEPFQAPSFFSYASGQGWCLCLPGRPHQPTCFRTFSAPSHFSFFSSLSWGSSCLHRLSQPIVCFQTPPQLHSMVEETFPVSSGFSVVLLYFSCASAMHSPLPPSAQEDLSYPHASIAHFPLSCPSMASSVTGFLIHLPPWYFSHHVYFSLGEQFPTLSLWLSLLFPLLCAPWDNQSYSVFVRPHICYRASRWQGLLKRLLLSRG